MIDERYAEAIENDEPITIDGLTLYPIKMSDYKRFDAAKSALLLRQSSLPVEYAVMRYLSALYAMDYDETVTNGKPVGFIACVLAILALAMRFPADAISKATRIITSDRGERELASLDIRAGDVLIHLTPTLFDRVRPILAAQNGLELPDETENIDLVEAEMDIAAQTSGNVVYDMNTVIASVARDQRCRRSALMDYTIREFNGLKAAIERDKLFTLYKTAELAGATFKDGNPVPSWCFDRAGKGNSLISMASFMSGPGSVATNKS